MENVELYRKYRPQTFEEIVGNGSIFEILNCQFLKRDVNKVLEQLYDGFGSSFKVTSNLLLMISVYELAMTLVILIVVTAVKKSEKVDCNKWGFLQALHSKSNSIIIMKNIIIIIFIFIF